MEIVLNETRNETTGPAQGRSLNFLTVKADSLRGSQAGPGTRPKNLNGGLAVRR